MPVVRTQIQLTEAQYRALRRAARARGVSMAEIVRRCIEGGIAEQMPDRSEAYARAAELVGKFSDRSRRSDVASQHDEYLPEAFGD